MGYYGVEKGWHDVEKTLDFVQLFWVVSGKLEFRVGSHSWVAGPGQSSVLYPGDFMDLTALERTRHRWMTYDGPLVREIVSGFGFGRGPLTPGPFPAPFFDELALHVCRVTPSGQQLAAALSYQFLSLAALNLEPQPIGRVNLAEEALEYIRRKYDDPALNVAAIADHLSVDRSVLSRTFKRVHGITVIDCLNAHRIQVARSLLHESALSITDIARRCGFSDPAYFSRVLQKRLGHGPRAYREKHTQRAAKKAKPGKPSANLVSRAG